jgi:hypothetical protein
VQALLARGGIDVRGQRLGHVMMMAELACIVCSGAPRGTQHTYALLAERAPGARSLSREEALAELARRYVRSHGPATVRDLARWATLTVADAARAIELLGDEAEVVSVGGTRFWRVGEPPRRTPRAHAAFLLQVYDEYLGGYSADSRRFADPDDLLHATPAVRTPFMHAIVLDGLVVGHWRPARKGAVGAVDVKLGAALDADGRAAVEAAVERYRRFVDRRTPPDRSGSFGPVRREQEEREDHGN